MASLEKTVSALEALPRELTVEAEEGSLLEQLQRSQKEAIEALTRATVLEGELEHTRESMRALVKKSKRKRSKA